MIQSDCDMKKTCPAGRGPEAARRSDTVPDVALIVLLAAFGMATCLYYGRRGFMPLDQSIVFDGGWRLLCGQVPFRDFTTPSGLVPIALQALFFKVFGVTWFAYCVHAAVFNGLFCVLVYGILRVLQSGMVLSGAYALLSAIVFYPPFGVPYMDQHAFFFTLLSLAGCLLAVRASAHSTRIFCWFLLPLLLTLAYFSKQIPTLFALPVVAAALVSRKDEALRAGAAMLSGAALAVGLLVVLVQVLSLDLALIKFYFMTLPSGVAAERMSVFDLGNLVYAISIFSEKHGKWFLLSPYAVYCIGILMTAYYGYRHHFGTTPRANGRDRFPSEVLIGVALLVICTLFIITTKNDRENGMAYIFASLGMVHGASLRMLAAKEDGSETKVQTKKRRILLAAFSCLLFAVALRDAYLFNRDVNASRSVHEMRFTDEDASRKATLPQELDFMVFKAPTIYPLKDTDLTAVANHVRNSPDNFLLIGDTSILYGLAGKPSVAPSLWFHPRLTLPAVGTEAFQSYEERLLINMERYRVRKVVVESSWTAMGTKLRDFPRVSALVDGSTCSYRSIGLFVIHELCPEGPGPAADGRGIAVTETDGPAH